MAASTVTHSEQCLAHQEVHRQYMRDWPNACKTCLATGAVPATYPEEPGAADPCPDCVEQGRCPRCGAAQPEDFSGESCDTCKWTYTDEATYMPHDECTCSWEIVCPDCKGTGTVTYQTEADGQRALIEYPTDCYECRGTGVATLEGPITIPYQPEMWAVLGQIMAERVAQDLKHGGPLHDDTHDAGDWYKLVENRSYRAAQAAGLNMNDEDYRQLMVEIAALVVAAIQSYDRKRKGQANGRES